jgi:putative intracellular protease/amidase
VKPARAVYVLVFPGFADWEPAHALAEVRRHGGYRVEVLSRDQEAVMSMGGLTIQPTISLAEFDTSDAALVILPGGDRWEQEPVEPELIGLLEHLTDLGIPIAAICSATTVIARADLLRGRRHTSNGLHYLRSQVPEYREGANYVLAPAVRDRGLITASGVADVEFAREILAELDVLSESEREEWTRWFRGGELPDEAG